MEQLFQHNLFEGARLIHLQTDRFKTTRITIRFAVELGENTAAAYAAVPGLLRDTSAAYPTNMLTERKLASLYGAGFSAAAGKNADAQILSFTISSVADRFAFEGEAIGRECLDFLIASIFQPDLDQNGLFKEENLQRNQRLMCEAIKADMNDKMTYSINRFCEAFYAGEGAAVACGGTLESVQALTVREVTDAWKAMLESAQVMVCSIGDFAPEPIVQAVQAAFAKTERHYRKPAVTEHAARKEVQHVLEEQALEQCKLNLGFAFTSDSLPAAKLFHMIFGGNYVSKLSVNVREKMSLCYYCSSAVGVLKKIIIVYSGVDPANREKAEQAILQQLEAMQRGEISDEEFFNAKQKLKEAFLSFDTPADIAGWYLSQMLFEHIQTPEQAWAEVEAVGLQEVIRFANTVQPDTVYALGGKQ